MPHHTTIISSAVVAVGYLLGSMAWQVTRPSRARMRLVPIRRPLLILRPGGSKVCDHRGGLGDARFPKWWTSTTPGQYAAGSPVGLLQIARSKDAVSR
jgi:hypothetical protein